MEPAAFEKTLRATVVPAQVSNEQFAAFLLVAKKYQLDPITKQIYAFPTQGGGIQPIVSIDGWMYLINSHPEFDGMEFEDQLDASGNLLSITCRMFRKDRGHPVSVTEYMSECARPTSTWKQWPARMLRHKAAIQASRYAFGFSGIMEPDEAERMVDVSPRQPETQGRPERQPYPPEKYAENLPAWRDLIESGKKTAGQVIAMVESKGELSDEQKAEIRAFEAVETETVEGEIVE
ncbi:MAG TPA: phage recombination protein Bet, partial [Acidimicrobiia bacterium]